MFDFTFQSGEFYGEHGGIAIKIFIAFIGPAVSLLLFYLKIRQDRRDDLERKRKVQEQRLIYLKSLVRALLKKTKRQTELIKEETGLMKENPLRIEELKKVILSDLKRALHGINHEEHFLAYNEILKRDDYGFREIVSYLDYFETEFDLVFKSHELSIDFDYKRKRDYLAIHEDVISSILKRLHQMGMNQNNDHYNKIVDVVSAYNEKMKIGSNTEGATALAISHDELISPILTILLSHPHSISFHEILVQLRNARVLFSQIKKQNQYKASIYERKIATMNEVYGKLEASSKPLLEFTSSQIKEDDKSQIVIAEETNKK